MPVKTADWDAIAASAPLDATAGRVVSQSGEHYDPEHQAGPQYFSSIAPPPMIPRHRLSGTVADEWDDLVGRRKGRLTVIGLANVKVSIGGARWAVRCDCGRWERRRADAIKHHDPANFDGCIACRNFDAKRRAYEQKGGRSLAEIAGAATGRPWWEIAAEKGLRRGVHSLLPLPLKPREDLMGEALAVHAEWVGRRVGHLRVLGLWDRPKRPGADRPGAWIVVCDCGVYEVRTMKALRRALKSGAFQACRDCEIGHFLEAA